MSGEKLSLEDPRVVELVRDFQARVEAGEQPDPRDVATRFPAIADRTFIVQLHEHVQANQRGVLRSPRSRLSAQKPVLEGLRSQGGQSGVDAPSVGLDDRCLQFGQGSQFYGRSIFTRTLTPTSLNKN